MNVLILILICIIVRVHGNTKIINGETASPGQFPYQAKLLTSKKLFQCGGSIINNHWIITAAHCCYKEERVPAYVEVGNSFLYPVQEEGLYSINKTIIHNNYVPEVELNDIALLYISTRITFNGYVNSIKLPKNNINKYNNKWVIGSGWGLRIYPNSSTKSYSLQYMIVKTISNTKCQERLGNVLVQRDKICTQSKSEKSACFGDSGGPIVNKKTLVGVISSVTRPTCGRPINIHSRVSNYLQWIDHVLEFQTDKL